jgi:translation elongation factor EF-1alpha
VINVAEEKLIGKITHYFGNINVGIIELADTLKVGETMHIKGASTDFEQEIDSMQVEHQDILEAKSGDAVGIKVIQKVKEGDQVYKVV